MRPLVTVIVPVYNTEDYLDDCLNSIMNQTLKELQVIIVNDCTPDKSMEIAERYVKQDPRFEIISHELNRGVGAARNTGIQNAKAEYITFLDSDDCYPLDALERLFTAITTHQSDVVIGRMFQKTSAGRLTPVNYIEHMVHKYCKVPSRNLRNLPSKEFYCGSATNQIYRTSLFKDNKIMFLEEVLHEDIPATLETWFYAKRIAVIPYVIHYRTVRTDANNLSATQTFSYKAFEDRDRIVEYVYNFCLDKARMDNDLIDLTLEILLRINGTTEQMLSSVTNENRKEIIGKWYPRYKEKFQRIYQDIVNLKQELMVGLRKSG